MNTLRSEEWVPPNVSVTVTEGVVHLWGFVDFEEQRHGLHVAAENTPGVKAVEDFLRSKRPQTSV